MLLTSPSLEGDTGAADCYPYGKGSHAPSAHSLSAGGGHPFLRSHLVKCNSSRTCCTRGQEPCIPPSWVPGPCLPCWASLMSGPNPAKLTLGRVPAWPCCAAATGQGQVGPGFHWVNPATCNSQLLQKSVSVSFDSSHMFILCTRRFWMLVKLENGAELRAGPSQAGEAWS